MLTVRGVEKSFAVRRGVVAALRGVDLEIPAGRMTAILGASGSGKTTLLRVIAGFERPDRGEVALDGRLLVGDDVFVRPERRGIGVVSQDGALFPHLDVAGNIGFGLDGASAARFDGRRRRVRDARVEELLELVGLAGYQRRRVDELSGGQQQRVALARALAPKPAVVALDEPFSALDAALRADLGMEVRELLAGLGVTAVLVTHDQQEALSLASTVAVMREGRVVQAGSPADVYERPVDADTARFTGDAVILDGRVVDASRHAAQVECALGTLAAVASGEVAAGAPCQVVIRPQQLALGPEGAPAMVVAIEYFGHEVLTRLRLGADGSGPEVRVRSAVAGAAPDEVARITANTPVYLMH